MEAVVHDNETRLISRRHFVQRTILGGTCAVLTPAVGSLPYALAQARPPRPEIGVNVGYALRHDLASANLAAFERVIARPVDYVVEYGAQVTWREAVTSAGHALRTWRSVVADRPRKLLWNQPLTVANTPLADVAAGKHDAAFEIIAKTMRDSGFPDAIVNLGWDMTGSWVPWSASEQSKDAYIHAYQRVASVFKRISPAFRLCWSPARHVQQIAPDDAYPGDTHVDLVGMAVHVVAAPAGPELPEYFDRTVIGHGLKPIPGRQAYALAWLSEFAKLHGKRIIIPELAVGVEVPGGHPLQTAPVFDDDLIITRLAEWIAKNDVALHCWRDLPSSEASAIHSRISRSSLITGEKPKSPTDERPRLSTAYRKAWGSNS